MFQNLHAMAETNTVECPLAKMHCECVSTLWNNCELIFSVQILFYVSWDGYKQTTISIPISTCAFIHRKLHLSGNDLHKWHQVQFSFFLRKEKMQLPEQLLNLWDALGKLFLCSSTRNQTLPFYFFGKKNKALWACISSCSYLLVKFWNKKEGLCSKQWNYLLRNRKFWLIESAMVWWAELSPIDLWLVSIYVISSLLSHSLRNHGSRCYSLIIWMRRHCMHQATKWTC